eukprot:XP_001699737.1 predicted protein [Chlamydomonas reinhardtii]
MADAQYLFVELESDGVWKVSVPNGQRFSKAFLAGLEVWARQLLAGEEPVLQRAVAAAAKTPSAAAPSNGSGAGADSTSGRVPNFIPPPPPPSGTTGAHPITTLTGSGLPGLDTIANGGGAAASSNFATPGSAAANGSYTGSVRVDGGGRGSAADGEADAESPELRSLDECGRLRVSVRLERQSLNDTELEMVADWFQERAASLLVPAKLWLFDNRIGDVGAAAVARALLHPALQELHLSHNFIGDKGAAALAAALPAQRPAGLRPLWLRLEWNMLNVDLLRERLDEQAVARGLVTDIPRIEATGKPTGRVQPGAAGSSGGGGGGFAPGHDLKLVLQRGVAAAVQLPWITCQKQAPSEADVLRAVKGFYRYGCCSERAAAPKPATPAAPAMPPPPPVLPEPQPGDELYRAGPLLLFPDTSALLAMLGGNASQLAGRAPPLDWGLLLELAGEGRFGRSLPPEEQVFIVVADSVMKQLDGLKTSMDACSAIRRFMRDGLEQAGPAGYDFLTLLGSHEGEGLALEAGGREGLAGSRSAAVSSRGQAVDMKIVEVALFFQGEVVRLSSATDLAAQLAEVRSSGGALTATLLRRLLAPQATKGLGSIATRSVQEHFDCAVGTMQGVVDALAALAGPLEQVTALAQSAPEHEEGSAAAALVKIRDLLAGGGSASAAGGGGLAAGVSALLSGLRSELAGWEGVIKSHQAPSRLVQWAALTPGSKQAK